MKKAAKKTAKKSQPTVISTPVSEAESDRRLRPALEALYKQNSKQALKTVQQALQKRKGWPAARALRACAYMQMERLEDSEKEMAELHADLDAGRVPLDEDCARKVHMYYREVRQEEKAGKVYEEVWKSDPSNVQLAETAFCLHIRGNAFANAQKVATKLHRQAAATTQKYALWALMAMWLGETFKKRQNPDARERSDNRLGKLMCAMLSKALEPCSIPTAETVRFAVRVYREAGDYGKAHELVSHPRLVMDEGEALQLRAQVSLAEGRSGDDLEELLSKHDPDDWAHWLKYFDSIKSYSDWESRAGDLIDKLVSREEAASSPRRGPFLAQLELYHLQRNYEDLSDAAARYFGRFGDKTVCAYDLRPYIALLQRANRNSSVLESIVKLVGGPEHSHFLSHLWLQTWNGCLEENPETLFSLFHKHNLTRQEPTETQRTDDYLLLAAHRLLPDTNSRNSSRYENCTAVLQAIAILEAGLAFTPANFNIKLILIRLYIEVGGLNRVGPLWDSLAIKHVQLATVTHLVLHPLFDAGYHDLLENILESIEVLWRECDNEIPECITKAIQGGSVNAAVEFVLFRMRLERSTVLAEAMVTRILHEVVTTGGEAAGVQRALSCIVELPRFSSRSLLDSVTLFENDDERCLHLWDTADYDVDDRLRDFSDEATEQGVFSTSKSSIAAANLQSLEVLLRLATPDVSEEDNVRAHGPSSTRASTSSATNVELPWFVALRTKISENLSDVKTLLTGVARGTSYEASEQTDSTGILPGETLQTARRNSAILAAELEDIVGPLRVNGAPVERDGYSCPENDHARNGDNKASDAGPKLTPSALRRCGRFVFDSLLVTAVALLPFGSILQKAKRRARKVISKETEANRRTSLQDFESARSAILEYKDAVLSASSIIQTWVASGLEQDLNWSASIFNNGKQLVDLVPYIPETIPGLVAKEDGLEPSNTTMRRAELCSSILEDICSSHATNCQHILETLKSISGRLTMVDL